MGWFYIKKGMLEDVTLGPISDIDALFQAFLKKELKADTHVMHHQLTTGKWVAFGQTKLHEHFAAKRQQMQQEVSQQKEAERVRAEAESRAREAENAVSRERARQAMEQQSAVHSAQLRQKRALQDQQRATEGSDRWPHLVRYAVVLELWALLMFITAALLFSLPGAGMLINSFIAIIGAFNGGGWMAGILALVLALVGLLLVALGVMFGYLIFLGIRCTADLLKCVAAIEANTRRIWYIEDQKPTSSPPLERALVSN